MNRAIKKFGTGKNRHHHLLDSKIEAAVILSTKVVERHEAIHVVRGYRTAKCAAREVLGDLACARGLAGRLWIADKNQIAARRSRDAGWVEGPDNFNAVSEARHAIGSGTESEIANASESRADVLVGLDVGSIDKRHNQFVLAGSNLHGNFRKARHDLVAPGGLFLVHERLIFESANR